MEQKLSEIILVEDSPGDAKLTIFALQSAHVANPVVHLKDGDEAIEYIFATGSFEKRNVENTPAIILLDLKMPKVNGIDVLKKIKSDESTRNIPVIIFTSSQEENDARICYNLGANSFVVKPFEYNKFEEIIKEISSYWLLTNFFPHKC
jgi:two-component system, response regulator